MIYKVPKIETERLVLKKEVTLDDYLKVNEFNYFYLYGIRGELQYKKNDIDRYKKYFLENEESEYEDSIRWYIYLKDSNKIIGIVQAHKVNYEENNIELMIHIHPNYWKKGYAYETISSVINYLFNELSFKEIVYTYDEGNEKSKRLAEKLGFEFQKEFIVDYEDGYFNKVKNIRNILTYERYIELNKR